MKTALFWHRWRRVTETAIFRAAPYKGVAASARIPTERVSGMALCVDPRRKPSAALGAPPPEDTVQPPPQKDWKQYMRDTIRESLADIMRSGLLATPERQAVPSRRRATRLPEAEGGQAPQVPEKTG